MIPDVVVVTPYLAAGVNSTGYYWELIVRGLEEAFPRVRVVTVAGAKPPRFVRQITALRAMWELVFSLLLLLKVGRDGRRERVVVVGSNPALLFLLFGALSPLIARRWVLVAFDVFPLNLTDTGILRRESWVGRALHALARRSYQAATMVVAIGRDMAEVLNSRLGVPNARLATIPNGIDPETVQSMPRNSSAYLPRNGDSKFVFQFFGNLGRVQAIDNLLEAIRRTSHTGSAFVFLGDGVMVPLIERFIRQHPDRSVSYGGGVPASRRAEALAGCDVALVTLSAGMYGLGVPSKGYFSLAADRPLLCVMDPGSELSLLVQEEAVGWTCPPNDPDRLARILDDIATGAVVGPVVGRARHIAESRCSTHAMVRAYVDLVHRVAREC